MTKWDCVLRLSGAPRIALIAALVVACGGKRLASDQSAADEEGHATPRARGAADGGVAVTNHSDAGLHTTPAARGAADGGVAATDHDAGPPRPRLGPQVSPEISAQYRFEECGRISASPVVQQTFFGADDSVLVLDKQGGLVGFESGAAQAQPMSPPISETPLGNLGMALSRDGQYWLRWTDSELTILRAADESPIGPSSGQLGVVGSVKRGATACQGAVSFSADGALLFGSEGGRICIWDWRTGEEVSDFEIPYVTAEAPRTAPSAVGVATGQAPVRVAAGEALYSYTLAGELVSTFEWGAASTVEVQALAFGSDARSLFVLGRDVSGLSAGGAASVEQMLLALDSETGVERWRDSFAQPTAPMVLRAFRGGYVGLTGVGVFDAVDGGRVVDDWIDIPVGTPADVSRDGRRLLTRGYSVVQERDLARKALGALYGSHAERVFDLDLSEDGTTLVSTDADTVIMWEVGSDFAASRPIVQSEGAGPPWNVAIAPDGSASVASGDNVLLLLDDGHEMTESPPAGFSTDCLSPDWSFSPDGQWVAGNRYGSPEFRSTQGFTLERAFPMRGCNQGVAFSPDGAYLATASPSLIVLESRKELWGYEAREAPWSTEDAVVFSPDGSELIVTRCEELVRDCSSYRYAVADGQLLGSVPALAGPAVRYSPEGHWLVSGETLLHLPTGASMTFGTGVTAALFSSSGDILAGAEDGSLLRYCRREP